jgi:hypothetical protein
MHISYIYISSCFLNSLHSYDTEIALGHVDQRSVLIYYTELYYNCTLFHTGTKLAIVHRICLNTMIAPLYNNNERINTMS